MRGRTTLACTILILTKEPRDEAVADGMDQGAAAGYDCLAELLASGAVMPSD